MTESLTFCGRTFGPSELDLMRQVAREFSALGVTEIARKVWGGNRTWEGARTQQILVSVLRTCWQQGKDAFTRCVGLLRASRGVILDIVPGAG